MVQIMTFEGTRLNFVLLTVYIEGYKCGPEDWGFFPWEWV